MKLSLFIQVPETWWKIYIFTEVEKVIILLAEITYRITKKIVNSAVIGHSYQKQMVRIENVPHAYLQQIWTLAHDGNHFYVELLDLTFYSKCIPNTKKLSERV